MILSHKSPNQSITSNISGDRQFILDLQNERGTTDSLRGIASEASCLHQQERKHSLRSEKMGFSNFSAHHYSWPAMLKALKK